MGHCVVRSVTCLDVVQGPSKGQQQAEKDLQTLKDQLKSKEEEFEIKTKKVHICIFSSKDLFPVTNLFVFLNSSLNLPLFLFF